MAPNVQPYHVVDYVDQGIVRFYVSLEIQVFLFLVHFNGFFVIYLVPLSPTNIAVSLYPLLVMK